MAGAIMTSTGQSWMTPPEIVEPVLEVFGHIDLDPCGSSQDGTVPARIKYTGPKAWGGDGRDGLSTPWWGNDIETVFVNPPFGRNDPHPEILDGETPTSIADWVKRCAEAADHGSEVIAVIPAAVDTGHWDRIVWPQADAICFLKGRVRFWVRDAEGKPVPAKARTTHAIAVAFFGSKHLVTFTDVFRRHGAVVTMALFRNPRT